MCSSILKFRHLVAFGEVPFELEFREPCARLGMGMGGGGVGGACFGTLKRIGIRNVKGGCMYVCCKCMV